MAGDEAGVGGSTGAGSTDSADGPVVSCHWQNRPVLVTGGASFIGSHLVDALVELGARVTVVDDFSSGRASNLRQHTESSRVTLHRADLHEPGVARRVCHEMDTLFHLAAAHGGRGFVDGHQAACARNLTLDGIVFDAAMQTGVRQVVFASSGCVYPLHLQNDPARTLLLTEDMVGPPYEADGMYGWAKLMGEFALRALHDEHGLSAVCCRYFTAYGPRAIENHAIIAMMARALLAQDPFEVWGDGTQVRNWTYVSDIVAGTILAAEHVDDASAINLGTSERITVADAARTIQRLAGHASRLEYQVSMPTGPYNRVANFQRAHTLLGWQPQVPFEAGVRRTFDWYRRTRRVDGLEQLLDVLLHERGIHAASLAEM